MVLGQNYKMYTECKLFLIFSFDRKERNTFAWSKATYHVPEAVLVFSSKDNHNQHNSLSMGVAVTLPAVERSDCLKVTCLVSFFPVSD